jgi:predicted nucleotidyltransferase
MEFSEIEDNIVMETITGSYLYGTSIETSDKDYCGIFIAPIDYYFGLKNVKEIDLSITSKNEMGKNTTDAIDRKFYEIKNFIKLASDCNPNIMEMLFVNDEQMISQSCYWQDIMHVKQSFIHKGLFHRFLGYAYSQKKKMIVKLDNHKSFEYVKDILEKADPTDTLHHVKDKLMKYFNGEFLVVGDIKIPLGVLNKKALSIINKRFSNMSHRKELIRKYGYDLKFASHLIRLTLEGIELLETGNLIFPLKERGLILDIKTGKYQLNEILEMFDSLEEDIKQANDKSSLPKKPDFQKLNNMIIGLLDFYFTMEAE